MKRVLVTGIGIVSPIGIGRKEFWENALAGIAGVKKVENPAGPDSPARIGGVVCGFDPERHLAGVKWKRISRVAQFALAAAFLAKDDAGLEASSLESDRAGVILGVGMWGMEMVEEAVLTCKRRGPSQVKSYSAVGSYTGASAANISVAFGSHGEALTLSTGCSSATNAIGYALRSIRAGDHDVMLAGGAESCLTPPTLASLGNAGVLSKRNEEPQSASRPFDRDRDGYVLGEGAAILVLESWDHARRRGAAALAELAGFGSTSDAFSMYGVEPEGKQADRAIEMAFKTTGIRPSDVKYVSAHGSSSVVSDRRETRVLRRSLGADADKANISSIKSMIGHPLGACGGFQTAACALTLNEGRLHPTINYQHPDPECDLDYVPNVARERRIRAALNLSLGMGGNNAALALKAV